MTGKPNQPPSRLVTLLLIISFLLIPAYLTSCGSGNTQGGDGQKETSTISGTITDNNNNPLPAARVSAAMLVKSPHNQDRTNSATATFTFTDANGWFILTNLPPGTYLITVEHPSHTTYSIEVTLTTDPAAPPITLNITVQPIAENTGTVTGTVTDTLLNEPLDNAIVFIDKVGTLTAADGSFTINGVTIGNQTLTVQKDRFRDYSETVNVTAGTNNLTIQLSPNTITGTVTFQSDIPTTTIIPLPNATIRLAAGSMLITASTDESGNYTFTHISPGTYEISSVSIGFSSDPQQIQVTTGTNQHDITTTPFVAHSLKRGNFNQPAGVAVDAAGYVYVADAGNHRIKKLTSNGEHLATWGGPVHGPGEGQFNFPNGVAVDDSGNIYVADSWNNLIQKLDPEGVYERQWGNSEVPFLSCPSGVAVEPTGNVYVADTNNNKIHKFNSNGNHQATWGSYGSGDGQFFHPSGIAVDAAGYVYVADTNNNRIQKFDSNGTYITQWGENGTGEGQFNWPNGVAVDAQGYVYVADTGNNRIRKFTSNGAYITKWGENGTGDELFNTPRGVAVDPAGNVYVADTVNNRIQKFTQSPP